MGRCRRQRVLQGVQAFIAPNTITNKPRENIPGTFPGNETEDVLELIALQRKHLKVKNKAGDHNGTGPAEGITKVILALLFSSLFGFSLAY